MSEEREADMKLYEQIKAYDPINQQEIIDQKVMLDYIKHSRDVLNRENAIAHFSASSWIVNKERTKVLMIYHNIYQSWSWTGGHADGVENLLHVALCEAKEETGLEEIAPLSNQMISLEILTVNGHIKRNQYVSSHLHLNVTYLLEADDTKQLKIKPDENSAVRWFGLEEAICACSEPWMRQIYQKLNDRISQLVR